MTLSQMRAGTTGWSPSPVPPVGYHASNLPAAFIRAEAQQMIASAFDWTGLKSRSVKSLAIVAHLTSASPNFAADEEGT